MLTFYIISTIVSLMGACANTTNPHLVEMYSSNSTFRQFYWAISFIPVANTIFALGYLKDLFRK